MAYIYSRYGLYLTRTEFTAYNNSEWITVSGTEAPIPTDDYWHHYAGSIALNGDMKFFIDGEEIGSTSYTGINPRHEGEPGMIGAYMPEDDDPVPAAEPSHFKGNIKEVAIFSSADVDIQTLYNNLVT